jgi:hypothetical protein
MNDEISYNESSSISSSLPFKSNVIHNVHDKGYHQIQRRKFPRGKFVLEYYETFIHQENRIRNAVTGLRYRDDHPKLKYLVGSRQEDLFFKVTIANGENGNNPVNLFYDNPEQFEKHQRVVVSQPAKEKWMKKNLECRIKNMKFFNSNE